MTVSSVIIVGSGPAGIGVASLLNQTDIDYLILEKKVIGASFLAWPKRMEMITPSFPSNAFGQIDLNSVCESTSPAFSFNKEHLTGLEYAKYLASVVDYFNIRGQTNTEVKKVFRQKEGWLLETNQGTFFCTYLVWAAGEFQNPEIRNIVGAEHCIHSALIKDPHSLEGDNFVVIGGYESGVQIAFDLIQNHKKVTLIHPYKIDDAYTSDPSRVLSPYTYNKYQKLKSSAHYTEILGEVTAVTKNEELYQIRLSDKTTLATKNTPICATGFSLVSKPVEEFIINRPDGSPKLDEKTDEFFGHKNIYLSGPSVRHDNHIFCFIYKFRQRFGVIAEDILKKEKYRKKDIAALVEKWKANGMYLSDLSCCDVECVC
ncbi:MAG: NAD(P)/FAD-dependent oxidoreductase [Bacteroidota bacterium]